MSVPPPPPPPPSPPLLFFFQIADQLQHTEDYCQLLNSEWLVQRKDEDKVIYEVGTLSRMLTVGMRGQGWTRTLKVSKLGALTAFSGTAFQSAMVRVCQFWYHTEFSSPPANGLWNEWKKHPRFYNVAAQSLRRFAIFVLSPFIRVEDTDRALSVLGSSSTVDSIVPGSSLSSSKSVYRTGFTG